VIFFNETPGSQISATALRLGTLTLEWEVEFLTPTASEFMPNSQWTGSSSDTKDAVEYATGFEAFPPLSETITINQVATGPSAQIAGGLLVANTNYGIGMDWILNVTGTIGNTTAAGFTGRLFYAGVLQTFNDGITNSFDFSVVSSIGVVAFSWNIRVPANAPAGAITFDVGHTALASAVTTYSVWTQQSGFFPDDWDGMTVPHWPMIMQKVSEGKRSTLLAATNSVSSLYSSTWKQNAELNALIKKTQDAEEKKEHVDIQSEVDADVVLVQPPINSVASLFAVTPFNGARRTAVGDGRAGEKR